MRKAIVILLLFSASYGYAGTQNDNVSLKEEISALQSKQKSLERNVLELTRKNKDVDYRVVKLETVADSLRHRVDSLETACNDISAVQKTDKDTLTSQIGRTKSDVQQSLSVRTLWGIAVVVAILLAIAVIVWLFMKKLKNGSTSIDEVRKAQDTLEKAQARIMEESVKLDNKLLEIAEQQLAVQRKENPSKQTSGEKDHSLTLKVADEITKIEMNLSRMDSSIKGYKQLSKAVQRIKDNFSANGYEIIDMLGKPYVAGMKAAVTFVTDESLEQGKQIITRIIKPQINYNGQMIQAAQIEVSQAE